VKDVLIAVVVLPKIRIIVTHVDAILQRFH